MISIISIGITECYRTDLCKIECAYSDAIKVYTAFEHILQDELSRYNSICLKNIQNDQFEKLIKTVGQSLSGNDILIIYFSGHGITKNDIINLVFSNADNNGNGLISSITLNEYLKNLPIKTLLILDCCYSGSALMIADNSSSFAKSKISVITSNEAYERASFNLLGSDFTDILEKSLISLYEKNQSISLLNIVVKIRSYGKTCLVNYLEGEPDLIIKAKVDYLNEYIDFDKKFLKKIDEEDISVKEMLWYSIMEYPASVQLSILKSYKFEPGEPSWLVRRAIGSVLSELLGFSEDKEKITLYLLKSDNWMLQCIGLIASRYLISPTLAIVIKECILTDKTKPMNVVWLANLYLIDSNNISVEESLASNLGKTSWGIIDIWRQYIKKMPYDQLYEVIFNTIKDVKLLAPLTAELTITKQFGEKKDIYLPLSDTYIPLIETKLVKCIYQQTQRGKTKNARKKWLVSLLYGSWRDQISLNLYDYFNNNLIDLINCELELAKGLPRVEMRMAIFQMMNYNEEIFEKHHKSLEWGLTDVHPWVRREAIKAYGSHSNKYIEKAFEDTINQIIYPGIFDMVIEAEGFGYITSEYIAKYKLTKNEIKSIQKYKRR